MRFSWGILASPMIATIRGHKLHDMAAISAEMSANSANLSNSAPELISIQLLSSTHIRVLCWDI